MSHDGHGVLNYRQLNSLFNRLFKRAPKKTSKLCVTGPLSGKSICDSRKGRLHGDPRKGPMTLKIFTCLDVIMICGGWCGTVGNIWWIRHRNLCLTDMLLVAQCLDWDRFHPGFLSSTSKYCAIFPSSSWENNDQISLQLCTRTTIQLSWHVQNCDLIWSSDLRSKQREFSRDVITNLFSGAKLILAGIPLSNALGENRQFSLQIMITSCPFNSAIVRYFP